jgi:exonuclease SbcC
VILEFVGSDGCEYEAKWSVSRAYGRIDGALQSKEWELLNKSTNVCLDKVEQIESAIKEAVGLDFDQFRRTTMLAQGEFSKFLNSKDDEKSSILEKITGTDIYSKIGKKIYDVTSEKKDLWTETKKEVEGVKVLTEEELQRYSETLACIEDEVKTLNEKVTSKREILTWIKENEKLTKDFDKIQKDLYQVKQAYECEEYKRKSSFVKTWNETIEVRLSLDNANKALEEKNKLISSAEEEILKNKYDVAMATLSSLSATAKKLKEDIEAEEKDFDGYALASLREALKNILGKITDIRLAKQNVETYKNECNKREDKRKELEEKFKELEQTKIEIVALTPLVEIAKANMVSRKQEYEKQSKTVNDFAKRLRTELNKGDVCPVCGQNICADLPIEEELEKIVSYQKEIFEKAEKEYEDASKKLIKLEADFKTNNNSYQNELKKYKEDTTLNDVLAKTQEACAKCGIAQVNEQTERDLETLLKECSVAETELNKKIKIGEDIEKQLVEKNKEYANLLSKVNIQQENVAKAETAKKDFANKLKNAEEKYNENDKFVKDFLSKNEGITKEKLIELSKYLSYQIKDIEDELKNIKDDVLAKQTLFDDVRERIEAHKEIKPQIAETENEQTLQTAINEYSEKIKENSEKVGVYKQLFATDKSNKIKLGGLIKKSEEAKQIYEKWNKMCNLLGSADGKTFRTIAQSYVLSHLIHAANAYMKTLSNRYTLDVVPGTFIIYVIDKYEGGVKRAASTISGGETFLVSLSLALALSDIGGELSVDILFIDEGFGTLSGESLQMAVETLRTLHLKANKHVGIISHVEELRDKIPVQIRVNQDSYLSSSTIEIVG